MGKKPAPKGKAAAKAKAAAEKAPVVEEEESAEKLEAKRLWQQRREATKWAKAQLDVVRAAQEEAKKRADSDWLQVANDFHEIRLIRACKRLEEKTLDEIPQELRDGLEGYLAQCSGAKAASVERESFRPSQEIWDLLPGEGGADAYKRPPESPESEAAMAKLQAWADASSEGVAALAAVMGQHAASAGVQEAGLVRLGGLFGEARVEGAAPMPGLVAERVMPPIEAAMRGHPADAEVQRAGCAALRGLAMADGQLPLLSDAGGIKLAVDAVTTHLKVADVVMAANGAFWAMAKAAGKNSPEVSTMRSCGVIEVLTKAMTHHAWDQTLVGRVRVTLPFIAED